MILEITLQSLLSSPKAFGYWTTESGKNVKLFFENFARSRNFSPLDPDPWYKITQQDIREEEVQYEKSILKNICI